MCVVDVYMSSEYRVKDKTNWVWVLPFAGVAGVWLAGDKLQSADIRISTEDFLSGSMIMAENSIVSETHVDALCSQSGGLIELLHCYSDKANETLSETHRIIETIGNTAEKLAQPVIQLLNIPPESINGVDLLVGAAIVLGLAIVAMNTTASRR